MLKDALYHIFVYPLESLLGFILSLLQGYCGSYGLSIILLSLLVNLLLLKLFFLADRASKNHALIKSKLDIKIAEFKRVFKGGELYAYIKTLYRQNHYHPIYALKTLGGLALQVPFFVAVVSLLEFHSPELKGVGFGVIPDLLSPDGLLGGINLLPLLMTFFTLCNVWISSNERGARIQGAVIALIFLVLLYKMPSALLLYWTTSMAFALLKSVCVKYIQLPHKEEKESEKESQTFFSKIFNAYFTKYSDLSPQDYKLYRNISIFAILNLCVLIFLYNPFALYASDVSQFDPKETWNTLGALFGFFLLISFLLIYSTSFFYKTRLLKIGAYGFCVMLMIALVYNFVLDYNVFEGKPYPNMDGLLFLSDISVPYIARYLDLSIGLIAMMLCCFLLRIRSLEKVIKFLFVFFALISLFWFGNIMVKKQIAHNKIKDKTLLMQEIKKTKTDIFNFSKTQQNILFIISDTIQSDIFMKALQEYPDLKEEFEGFVYYPNLLSVSSITYLSVPAIVGGNYYHPINTWKRIKKNGGDYKQEALNAYTNLIHGAEKEGYQISLWAGYPADKEKLKKIANKNIEIVDDLLEAYAFQQTIKKNKIGNKKQENNIGDFISFGFFKIFPYTLRTKVYVGNGWIFGESLYFSHIYLAVQTTAHLNIVNEIFDTNSKEKTFKIIHEFSNHYPWLMDYNNDCRFVVSKTDYKKSFLTDKESLIYSNHLCYLEKIKKLFATMKRNGVYDNTKIILVSDHGVKGYKINTNEALDKKTQSSHALLLVKDFGQKNGLRIDHSFVSNAQAFYEVCNAISNNSNIIGCEEKIREENNRFFVFSNRIDLDHFSFDEIYEVKDNIYDPKNWKDVTKEFLDNLNKKEETK